MAITLNVRANVELHYIEEVCFLSTMTHRMEARPNNFIRGKGKSVHYIKLYTTNKARQKNSNKLRIYRLFWLPFAWWKDYTQAAQQWDPQDPISQPHPKPQ